ncbi:hypothetical protein Q5530_13175 [Saccharothrix sp. BKS2]|uniref:hypothetical protein n=1 Tax=Saccharothrix sp. BKS2 TaxID=3064400 RepID=UPI0039E7DA5E
MREIAVFGLTSALTTATFVVAAQSPAAAAATDIGTMASVSCHVVTSHCQSSTIAAGSNHTISYSVGAGGTWNGCSWRVKDINTGVSIASGRTGAAGQDSGWRDNLHGTYRIELWNCSFGAVGALYS